MSNLSRLPQRETFRTLAPKYSESPFDLLRDKIKELKTEVQLKTKFNIESTICYADALQLITRLEQHFVIQPTHDNDLPLQMTRVNKIQDQYASVEFLENSVLSSEDLDDLQAHKRVLEDYRHSLQELKQQNQAIKTLVTEKVQQRNTQALRVQQQIQSPQQTYAKKYIVQQTNDIENNYAQLATEGPRQDKFQEDVFATGSPLQHQHFVHSLQHKRIENARHLKELEESQENYLVKDFDKKLHRAMLYSIKKRHRKEKNSASPKKTLAINKEIDSLDKEILELSHVIQKIVEREND